MVTAWLHLLCLKHVGGLGQYSGGDQLRVALDNRSLRALKCSRREMKPAIALPHKPHRHDGTSVDGNQLAFYRNR